MTQPLAQEQARPSAHPRAATLADFVALAKPRITLMVLVTAYGGAWLAQKAQNTSAHLSLAGLACALGGIALIVSGANALNMYFERDVDARMTRTRRRPLPAGRMSPRAALVFGAVTSAAALPVLALGVNAVTAFLAVLANLLYVFAYTPMKQRSHKALHVGAVPGAIPPLLGWTAVTGRVDAAGLALFGVLFFWQLPHFLAIALFRKGDYARAGLVVMPNVAGDEATRRAIVWTTFALVVASLSLVPLGVAHRVYFAIAATAGAAFFALASRGLRAGAGDRWAKRVFGASIVYLLVLMAAIVLDG
jgi:protoheme IX farnesyltransferase